MLIAVIISCILLAVLEAIDSFVVKNIVAKYVFFGLDTAAVLVLCIFTGNTYMSTLYCLVLTQIYISIDSLRENIILFSVSCALFLISFVLGRIVDSSGTIYADIVEILGDSILGISILAIHFMVTNFILRFYSKNQQLRNA